MGPHWLLILAAQYKQTLHLSIIFAKTSFPDHWIRCFIELDAMVSHDGAYEEIAPKAMLSVF